MTGIRFLHTADLHLDTPFKGMAHFPAEHLEKLRNSTFEAFNNLIQYAVETRPDFIVIVGDLYDGEDRSLRAQLKFQEGMKVLKEANIPVFLSYGNHDHLNGRWTRFELPNNVHLFDEQVEQKSLTVRGKTVNLYGFSYGNRHVPEPMIDAYPVADSAAFHIGLLHGSVEGDALHAVYAPFTKADLLLKQYDYWALGHIHKRQLLHEEPPIVYPGNIQGRHRNEHGAKGFYDVILSKRTTEMKFIPTATITFENLSVSCRGIRHAGEWFDLCEAVLKDFQERNGAAVIRLQMIGIDEETTALFHQSTEEEWLFALREQLRHYSPFIWISDISYETFIVKNEATEALMNPVISTMDNWEEAQWQEVLSELYQHTHSLQYLERLTEADLKEIQSEVEKNLLIELSNRK